MNIATPDKFYKYYSQLGIIAKEIFQDRVNESLSRTGKFYGNYGATQMHGQLVIDLGTHKHCYIPTQEELESWSSVFVDVGWSLKIESGTEYSSNYISVSIKLP